MAEADSFDATRQAVHAAAGRHAGPTWSCGAQGTHRLPLVTPSILIASLAINLLSLALPLVILQVYDRILPNGATETLLLLIIGLCVVLLLDGVLRVARSYIVGWHAARFEHRTGCAAVERLLSADVRSLESEAPGVHLDRLAAVDVLRDFYAGQGKLLIADLPFIVLFIGLMWLIGHSLALVPVGMLLLLCAAAYLTGRALKEALSERAALDDRRYSFIIEVLRGMLTVKSLAMEALLQRRYERLQESGAVSTYRVTFLSNLGQSLGALFSNLSMVCVAAAGAVYVMAGQLSIGGLAACTLLAGRAVQPLLRALGLWTQMQNFQLAQQRLDDLFNLTPEAAPNAHEVDALQGAIELKDVSFRYNEGEPFLLDNVNLSIAPGEVIGISGGTGCGKSTLLMLMERALVPTSGQVVIDDNDSRTIDPFALRQQIAHLPQNASLLQGTILDNLSMFRGTEAEDRAIETARRLGLDKLIRRLPEGYETRVGTGSSDDLPKGTQQAIAMTRPLAGEPRIVLFDEANSAADRRADLSIKEMLQSLKGGPTMVLVSHRPSLLALADRVFDLTDGQLVQRQEAAGAAQSEAGAGALGSEPAANRSAALS